jgi:hypothetical protein
MAILRQRLTVFTSARMSSLAAWRGRATTKDRSLPSIRIFAAVETPFFEKIETSSVELNSANAILFCAEQRPPESINGRAFNVSERRHDRANAYGKR